MTVLRRFRAHRRTRKRYSTSSCYLAFMIKQGRDYCFRRPQAKLQMGFGVWSLADFEREFNGALSKHSAAFDINEEAIGLVVLASILFPDRIPLVLEKRFATMADGKSEAKSGATSDRGSDCN